MYEMYLIIILVIILVIRQLQKRLAIDISRNAGSRLFALHGGVERDDGDGRRWLLERDGVLSELLHPQYCGRNLGGGASPECWQGRSQLWKHSYITGNCCKLKFYIVK
jgi:hypothetical protein